MTDKKLTDGEVVKAWECCIREECSNSCPLLKDNDCQQHLQMGTLHLINRQKAKIEYQEAEIELLRDERVKANNEINRLQAEKAVLNRKLTDAYLMIDKLKGD